MGADLHGLLLRQVPWGELESQVPEWHPQTRRVSLQQHRDQPCTTASLAGGGQEILVVLGVSANRAVAEPIVSGVARDPREAVFLADGARERDRRALLGKREPGHSSTDGSSHLTHHLHSARQAIDTWGGDNRVMGVEQINGTMLTAFDVFSAAEQVNGDGILIYPPQLQHQQHGAGAVARGRPLSSIRLENIRDGIEDFELFHAVGVE
eukprot:SAG22_NODE_8530_length_648_cov_0.823315_1_plen_208_part_01